MSIFGDAALIVATLGGPVFAVQAQTFLERRRAGAARRLNVFRTVMPLGALACRQPMSRH
jgi:hypothetical protein